MSIAEVIRPTAVHLATGRLHASLMTRLGADGTIESRISFSHYCNEHTFALRAITVAANGVGVEDFWHGGLGGLRATLAPPFDDVQTIFRSFAGRVLDRLSRIDRAGSAVSADVEWSGYIITPANFMKADIHLTDPSDLHFLFLLRPEGRSPSPLVVEPSDGISLIRAGAQGGELARALSEGEILDLLVELRSELMTIG
jgi:hypothetical protein